MIQMIPTTTPKSMSPSRDPIRPHIAGVRQACDSDLLGVLQPPYDMGGCYIVERAQHHTPEAPHRLPRNITCYGKERCTTRAHIRSSLGSLRREGALCFGLRIRLPITDELVGGSQAGYTGCSGC